MFRFIRLVPFLFFFCISAASAETAQSLTEKKIVSALGNEIRSVEEKARDQRRKPLQTLKFFGLQDDMRVLELFPGGGWYTKILGDVLREKGELHLAMGLNFLDKGVKKWGEGHLQYVSEDKHIWQRSKMHKFIRYYDKIEFGLTDLDMVLTFRNMHNMTPHSRILLNKEVFKSLKPGGVYGVIDHTRRHMEPYSVDRWRRVDPVRIIKEALDAGFILEDWSDMHARAEDGLIYDSVHPSLDKFSDRFTLKFRKPK